MSLTLFRPRRRRGRAAPLAWGAIALALAAISLAAGLARIAHV